MEVRKYVTILEEIQSEAVVPWTLPENGLRLLPS